MTKEQDAEPPFAGHRRYYVLLKIVVLIIAAVLALRFVAPLIV